MKGAFKMAAENKSIMILHISDMHMKNKSDINSTHIIEIVNSLKTYNRFHIEDMLLIISGDLSSSGKKDEFLYAKFLIGQLIKNIKSSLSINNLHVLVVPGNHDVDHYNQNFDINAVKRGEYSKIEINEHNKQKYFYTFSKFNKCFSNDDIYFEIKELKISGINIHVNLINNAIYSYCGEYKGLLYLPNDAIEKMSTQGGADFVISIMHHSPDYYRDNIKNNLEEKIINKSNILFHGHEHNNTYKITEYRNCEKVIIQSCGALCDQGNWESSSFIAGILDVNTKKYTYSRFAWNANSSQYEHDRIKENSFSTSHIEAILTEEFKDYIKNNYCEEYFTFPSIKLHTQKSEKDQQINSFEPFFKEVLRFQKVIISGDNSIGKTSLLLKLFKELSKDHSVIYCSSELILQKSKNKSKDLNKLIKACFEDIYEKDESKWQSFERKNKDECVFIFDDFDQVYNIDTERFIHYLSSRFGIIIISTNQTINFNPKSIIVNENENIAKFDIKPLLGKKRKELIRKIVEKKTVDKSTSTINNIVEQINNLIKSQVSIIPPEPYYIIQISENFINNIGEAVNSHVNVFSKVFESNITTKIDKSIQKHQYKGIRVELIYVLLSKIAYYIHFNKKYPISRKEIDKIIENYNFEYGDELCTEDILRIIKSSKILINSNENSELYRFRNKSLLAYFVAKEIVSKFQDNKDPTDLKEIINKCCINICTDILLFIIYQTDDVSILKNIMNSISIIISSDLKWQEFDMDSDLPPFLENYSELNLNKKIEKKNEQASIENAEEKSEEAIITELKVHDIYDWDDTLIDEFNNRLIKMVSLLHVLAKALPSFGHRLKKSDKQQLIEYLYTIPNSIFMYWISTVKDVYDDMIKEILPYMAPNKPKATEKDKDKLARILFASYSMDLLLNLYYTAALNASAPNTYKILDNTEMYDYTTKETHKLQHLMFLEQDNDNNSFVSSAINLKKEVNENLSKALLSRIARHGIITRNDSINEVNRLESTFGFTQRNHLGMSERKRLLINKRKYKSSKK